MNDAELISSFVVRARELALAAPSASAAGSGTASQANKAADAADATPPYDIHLVVIDDNDGTVSLADYLARQRQQHVLHPGRQARKLPTPPDPPGASAGAITIHMDGEAYTVSSDGWIALGKRRERLVDFLASLFAAMGWGGLELFKSAVMRVAIQTAAGGNVAQAVSGTLILALASAVEITIAHDIVAFLRRFEGEMVGTLTSVLETNREQAAIFRTRYLDEEGKLLRDPANPNALAAAPRELLDHLSALARYREELVALERRFAHLTEINRVGQVLSTPVQLRLIGSRVRPDQMRESWGDAIGGQLERWFASDLAEYTTARDGLVRAQAQQLATARAAHPLVSLLWPNEDNLQPDVLATSIADMCEKVQAECERSLRKLREGGFALVEQRVTVLRRPPEPNAMGDPIDFGDADELPLHLHLVDLPRPEEELARLLAERESPMGRLGLAGELNAVTVWDMDLIRQEARARIEPTVIEDTALRLLDLHVARRALPTAMRDIGIALALSATPGGGAGVFALLSVFDAMYELERYFHNSMLADSEFIASSTATRRILSREPSFVPLFLALVGLVGDVAAVSQFPRIADALGAGQLALVAGWIAGAAVGSREDRDAATRELLELARVHVAMRRQGE